MSINRQTSYSETDTTGIASIVDELRASARISTSAIMQKRSAYMERILEDMTPEEELRFEFFVRSHFNKNAIKRVLQGEIDCAFREYQSLASSTAGIRLPQDKPIQGYFTTGPNLKLNVTGERPLINDDMAVAVSGLTKLFVGELCDTAVTLMKKRKAQERAEEAEELKKQDKGGKPKRKKKRDNDDQEEEEPEESIVDRLSVKDVEDAAQLMFDNGKLGRPRSKLLGAVDIGYLPYGVTEGRGIPPLPSDVVYPVEESEDESSEPEGE